MRSSHLVILVVICLLFTSCKKDSTTAGSDKNTIDLANDYFPISPSYQWTFNSNAFSDSGKVYSNFDLRIDTAAFHNGIFLAIKIRFAGNPQWLGLLGLKDSGNVIYNLSDNPPASMVPMFKHSYTNTEGTIETIMVSGTPYEALKVTFPVGAGKSYSVWLAKGIGLIKDSSSSGVSLFADDNQKYNVVIKSTLVGFQK